jgi:hypothetical protein
MQSKIHDGENNAHDSRAGVIGHPQKTTNVLSELRRSTGCAARKASPGAEKAKDHTRSLQKISGCSNCIVVETHI